MLPVLSGGVALLAVLWIGEGAQRLASTPAATVLSMQEIRYAG